MQNSVMEVSLQSYVCLVMKFPANESLRARIPEKLNAPSREKLNSDMFLTTVKIANNEIIVYTMESNGEHCMHQKDKETKYKGEI